MNSYITLGGYLGILSRKVSLATNNVLNTDFKVLGRESGGGKWSHTHSHYHGGFDFLRFPFRYPLTCRADFLFEFAQGNIRRPDP